MVCGSAATASGPHLELVGAQDAPAGAWDILTDGRIIGMEGEAIVAESAVGSGVYEMVGLMPAGLIAPWGASFVSVSPDGSRLLIGDNFFDGAFVYLVNSADLTGGEVTPRAFLHENFDAAWMTDHSIAISYGNPTTFLGEVAILDVDTEGDIPVVTIGGASGGIAIDENGNLLTSNGFDFVSGGSETGDVRAFSQQRIAEILDGQSGIVDFETEGAFVYNALSGSPLHFDTNGNLFIGGGRSDETDFFAIADGGAVADAMSGSDPVGDADVFVDDPIAGADSIYRSQFNPVTGEWVIDGFDGLLYRYVERFCLALSFDQLRAGAMTTFTVAQGVPGQRVGIAYGFDRGTTLIQDTAGFCATFGIRGVNRRRTVGDLQQVFDPNGEAQVRARLPRRAAGRRLLFQATEGGTCPDECVSNVVSEFVQ